MEKNQKTKIVIETVTLEGELERLRKENGNATVEELLWFLIEFYENKEFYAEVIHRIESEKA